MERSEGRDAAGKGGTIERFMDHPDPRGARVVAPETPGEPTPRCFQRRIVAGGGIVFSDRSWHGRARMERVMGERTAAEDREVARQAPGLDRIPARAGLRLFKARLGVTREEQARRSGAREPEPPVVGSAAPRIGNGRHVRGASLHPGRRRGKAGA